MREHRLGSVWGRRLRRRTFVRGAAVLGAATGTTTLAGCSTPATVGAPTAPAGAAGATAVATQAPAARVKYGGVFRAPDSQDTPNLDVHQNITFSLFVTGPAIAYSKLVQRRTDVKPGQTIPTGDLAESWEQADEATYIFKLRRNAKFHNIPPVNGRAVVAEDAKYSFERQLAEKINAGTLAGITKIEAVDPQTLKLTLGQPDADFLASLTDTRNKIVAREVVELRGDLREPPVIGSGPWIFEKWEKDNIASLVKNPDYYLRGFPRVDRIEFPRVRDTSTQQSAFRTQQLDVLSSLTPQEAETIRQTNPNGIAVDTLKAPQGNYLALNTTKAPFSDIRVRQAVFKAINKQQIMDTLFNGQAWYFPNVPMAREEDYLPEAEVREAYKQDLAAAKRLLTEAGFTGGTFDMYVLNISQVNVDAGQLVKSQLAEIGFNLNLKLVDSTIMVPTVFRDASHEMALIPTNPNPSTNAYLFNTQHSRGGRNAAALKDPKLDALIEQQAVIVKDPEARKKLLWDIQRYILMSAHQFHLYGSFVPIARWKYVQDYFAASPGVEESYPVLWLDK